MGCVDAGKVEPALEHGVRLHKFMGVSILHVPALVFRAECAPCRNALGTERELLRSLGEKEPTFVEVTRFLAE